MLGHAFVLATGGCVSAPNDDRKYIALQHPSFQGFRFLFFAASCHLAIYTHMHMSKANKLVLTIMIS
jgi:tryptophan-rich sensory protein